jgi:S-adenosylmethionine synthetase
MQNLQEGHYFFTSESVTEGHPDKICDLISDSILDACLAQDPYSKVAMETIAKSNMILLAGELTTEAKINIDQLVRDKIKDIGYDDEKKGLNYKTCDVIQKITLQSKDISQAVHENKKEEDLCAGDQGIMFGYATNETEELFPFSHLMALRLSLKLTEVRKKGEIKYLRPDGKTQVTVEYKEVNGKMTPIRVETVLISTQHDDNVSNETIKNDIMKYVVKAVIPDKYLDDNTKYFINPSGKFIIGGPEADAGLTGRKIIVDTYGGWGAHGGGAFSGKDPSKVDRSGAYAARWIAKSLVNAGLCERVLVQISYSIGIADPLSIFCNTYGTVKEGYTDKKLVDIIKKNFCLKPGIIIKDLNLKSPIYSKTACGGHFSREDQGFPWEVPKKLDLQI